VAAVVFEFGIFAVEDNAVALPAEWQQPDRFAVGKLAEWTLWT